ncbi:MAG: DegT/DnrJ/EryC1/StrS family aminotransferase [Armatimonadota bacterium]|jgi:dTDP-4-amino-4,6-dideoxygalactose transaminase
MGKLALLGGDAVRRAPWPPWPDPREEDIAAVSDALRSGQWWSYAGQHTEAFEKEYAQYHDARHGITVNSGTTALMVALEALEIGPGDEVIVPAYTFQATATSALLANAIPVFADVQPNTMNIDPDSVAALITSRTRAIVPVHIAGLPADMARLAEVAEPRRIALLEDAAQAHGAVWRGKKVGSIGHAGAFSFQASKNLPSGEGGIVLTDNDRVAARAAGLRDCGRVEGRPFYEHHLLGGNFRITEMQTALLRSRLKRLEYETDLRWRNGQRLTSLLRSLPGIEPLDPEPAPGDRRAYHLYAVRLRSEKLSGISRDRFMQALSAEGIPCSAGYGQPLYKNPVFQQRRFRGRGCPATCGHYSGTVDYCGVSCPTAETLCNEVIWLFHSLLLGSDRDVDDIYTAFEKVTAGHGQLV